MPPSRPSPAALDARLLAVLAVIGCTVLTIALDPGIQVGRENHAGLLPVVRRLLDPDYLPGDFGISLRLHHHRVFAWLVAALSVPFDETGAFAVLTVTGYAAIFAGLWRLGGVLGLTPPRRVLLAVALATGFAFLDHGVEANRFLGNGPIMPPTFAHALILFATAATVQRRWNLALVLSGAVALIHLQIGAIWLIVMAVLLAGSGAWRTPRAWLPGVAGALLIASPALLDLWALARAGIATQVAGVDDIGLRMPQHFRFHGNRVAAVALYLGLLAWLWRRWRRAGDPRAGRVTPLLAICGCLMAMTLLHYLDYYVLHSGWIARLQMLRLSVLVPVLAAAAIVMTRPAIAGAREYRPLAVAALFAVAALGAAAVSDEPPSLRVDDRALAADDWADACRWVRRHGPPGPYLTPPGQTGFTAYSNRSTVVEFKINPDGGAGLAEWVQRLRRVTGGTLPASSTRAGVAAALDRAYARLPAANVAELQRVYGVRAAVVPADSTLPGRVLYRNAGYRVVSLAD